VLAAIEGRRPIIRSDGTPQRDFLYVEDAVAAYLAISELLDDGRAGGEAFNASGGGPRSVLEVVDLVCRIAGTGVEPDVRGTSAPPGESARTWVDSSKLQASAGWQPRVGLEDGLRRTIAWYREHLPTGGAGAATNQVAG
jgi:CDP-glucose 4,6-dehydratase